MLAFITISKSAFNSLLNYKDIRFWIIVFFIIRLWGVTDPPLEIAHNWRQVTGCMVARNFVEIDANIFYPRLDMAGEKTGITGTEFPVLNYLIYIVSLIFGYDHWYGRLINLVISSLGIWYFHAILKRFFTSKVAFVSSLLLLGSIWFSYSRKIMPDTFSASLCLIGLQQGLWFLYNPKYKYLIGFGLFSLLGILSKIPAIIILSPILIPLMHGPSGNRHKLELIGTGSMAVFLTAIWYFHWVPYLVEAYGYWHYYMGKSFHEGWSDLWEYLPLNLEKFYFDALKFSGFAATLFGIGWAIKNKEKGKLAVLGIAGILFFIFIAKAGHSFSKHSYYIIPFVPFMALIAGYGISCIKKRWVAWTFTFLIVAEGIGNYQHDFRIKQSERYKLSLERIANTVSSENDLIAINGGENPQQLYFTNRKGWTISTKEALDPQFTGILKQKGCKWIFINKKSMEESQLPYKKGNIKYEDNHYIVVGM